MASPSVEEILAKPTGAFKDDAKYVRQPDVLEILLDGDSKKIVNVTACVNCRKCWCKWIRRDDFEKYGFSLESEHTFENIEYCEAAEEPFRTYPDAKCTKWRHGSMGRP